MYHTHTLNHEAQPNARSRLRVIAMVIASAVFMQQLDGTVLATALPSMANTFGVDAAHLSIALTSYLVSLAVLIPASGQFADRFGSRTVFTTAVALFTIGSILCAHANQLSSLVVARLLQGAGGAVMVPVGRLVLLQVAPKAELISVMNWVLVPAALGPLLGPPVGGFLVTEFDWRWIFYINVPIGVAGFAFALGVVPQIRAERLAPFDKRGMALLGAALAALIFGMELVIHGAVSFRAGLFVLGCAAFASLGYAWHARGVDYPILDFRLMKIETFRLSVLAGAATSISMGAMPFLIPLMFQIGLGMSATQCGRTAFIVSIGSLSMRGVSRQILRRFGYRTTMLWNGAAASAFAFACATFHPRMHHLLIAMVLFAGGFFNALQFTAYSTIAYADVPQEQMSSATSLYATLGQVQLTFGICVAAAVLAVASTLHGNHAPSLTDFSASFVTIGLVSLLAPVLSAMFSPNAGSEISGHRR